MPLNPDCTVRAGGFGILICGFAAWLLLLIPGCQVGRSAPDADVIVVGGGIAGLAAALEAAESGASVLVIEESSVAGGHAVRAGGLALVDTPLQRTKGYEDSPDIAVRDLLNWGETADEDWVTRYAEGSRTEVHDWLAGMGVEFAILLDTPEDSVPRFHFTRGGAVNVVVPMLRKAFETTNIRFLFDTTVRELVVEEARVTGVIAEDAFAREQRRLTAPAVVLATGGFQSDLQRVRNHWPEDLPHPNRLLIGSGQYATGAGLELAQDAAAKLTRMDQQVTFVTGLPNPRKPTHGLLTQNPAAIWVNAEGRRFADESAPSKFTEQAVLRMQPSHYWMVFDATGRRALRVRGASWLNNRTIADEILDNEHAKSANSIRSLAVRMGVPAKTLKDTVARFNRYMDVGTDLDFDRFSPTRIDMAAMKIEQPPFYALQLFPMTRKSMGGLAIDADAQVVDADDEPIPGLYAAGELTGVAGINGSYGQSGTFLGPSVLTGRIAGRSAAHVAMATGREHAAVTAETPSEPEADKAAVTMDANQLGAMLDAQRDGKWHFAQAHGIVLERKLECARCHSTRWPTAAVQDNAQRLVQLESCTVCH